MEEFPPNKENEPTSFIRINREHNVKELLDVLRGEGVEIVSIVSSDPRPEAPDSVEDDFIPSMNSMIEVKASYQEIKDILENSEFKNDISGLIGSV